MQMSRDRGHRQYFAYGENMHPDVILERCASPRVIGTARLPAFRMDFFGYSARWDGAMESAVRDPREEIWGVLYELDFDDAELLDGFLDVRLDGTGSHYHMPVEVTLSDGTVTDALMHVLSEMGRFRPPSSQYLSHVVDAARKRGLPKIYIERLYSTPCCPATYTVPREAGLGPATCDCGGDLRQELRLEMQPSGMGTA